MHCPLTAVSSRAALCVKHQQKMLPTQLLWRLQEDLVPKLFWGNFVGYTYSAVSLSLHVSGGR